VEGSAPVDRDRAGGRKKEALRALLIFVVGVTLAAAAADEQKPAQQRVTERQASLAKLKEPDRAEQYAKLALDLADLAGEQYDAGNLDAGNKTVAQVVEAAQKAHSAAAMKKKKIKEAEINLRRTENKLNAVMRSLSAADQGPIKKAIASVEKARADTLEAMFK
jgi:hypothetical protein